MFNLHHVHLPTALHFAASGQQIVNFHAERGTIHWLIGPAGGGKTVLLETLALLRPLATQPPNMTASGPNSPDGDSPDNIQEEPHLSILGHDITPRSTEAERALIRQHISFINATPLLQEEWSVFDNIALPLRLKELKKGDILRETNAVIRWIGLQDYTGYCAGRLSLSLQQRVVIARNLVNRPSILLADLNFIEPEISERFFSAVSSMAFNGCTVVLATQDEQMRHKLPAPSLVLPVGWVHEPEPAFLSNDTMQKAASSPSFSPDSLHSLSL